MGDETGVYLFFMVDLRDGTYRYDGDFFMDLDVAHRELEFDEEISSL